MKNSLISYTRKNSVIILILIICLFLSVAAGLSFGAVKISFREIFRFIVGGEFKTSHRNIFLYTRVPRVLACIFSGAALAVSGVILQCVLSNPLASPNIIGVNAGGAFAVLISNIVFPQFTAFTPLFAFLGAFIAVVIILVIGYFTNTSKITLILSGVAVSAIFNAGNDMLINLFPDSVSVYTSFKSGAFSGITLERIAPALIIITISLVITLFFSRDLDLIMLGSQQAHALGLNVRAKSIFLLAVASLFAASAVSICGIIGFVGLIVPHMMRRFVGENSGGLIITSCLGGALLVNTADLFSRMIFSPYELPAGILLSFIGGPFFLFLLITKRGNKMHA